MKKNKLKLKLCHLKVQSFITSVDGNAKQTIIGMDGVAMENLESKANRIKRRFCWIIPLLEYVYSKPERERCVNLISEAKSCPGAKICLVKPSELKPCTK